MFKRLKSLFINGREIADPVSIELAQYMTANRALFVAQLRVERDYTWRMVALECGRAWGNDWGERQDVGASLCGLAAAHLGEDWSYLDTL